MKKMYSENRVNINKSVDQNAITYLLTIGVQKNVYCVVHLVESWN